MEWPRGEATACKAVYTGSNPVSTSHPRAIGAVVARFVHTEEVTGSNPVSPTPRTVAAQRVLSPQDLSVSLFSLESVEASRGEITS